MTDILTAGLTELGLDTAAAAALERYADALLEKNKVMNLTAITQPDQVATLHLLDCAALLPLSGYAGALADALPDLVVGVLPAHPLLAAPTFAAQMDAAGARLLFGRQEQTAQESQSVLVAAMTLPNVLQRLEPESTVILPSDRSEMIPGVLLAQSLYHRLRAGTIGHRLHAADEAAFLDHQFAVGRGGEREGHGLFKFLNEIRL